MADYKKPTVDSNYIDFVDELHQAINTTATWNDGNNQNIPVGAKRWNDTSKIFEKYTGTQWIALSSRYNLPVYWGSIINKPAFDSSVTSTSTTTFATPKAVKTAYDKAVDAYTRAETTERNAKAASLPITGGNLTGNLTAPYINVGGAYISVNVKDGQYGGLDIIRQGNIGNWLSRIEALPDKRWKFWLQDSHEVFLPAKSGTVALDHEVVHKTGDVMNWLTVQNQQAWMTIKSTNHPASGIDFINSNGVYPQVSLHAFDVGGWADELRIFTTPPGNDYNSDRRQHAMTIAWDGNIWTRMYGWLGDRFMDKTKAYDNWYPNHYLGAQVFKIPLRADGSGLKIIIMQVNISRDTELWLPESFNGFYIPTATDFGGGKYSLGIMRLSGNQVKVFCSGSNVTIQVHCIGWSN